jgi:uncharacterized membrane protein YkoI
MTHPRRLAFFAALLALSTAPLLAAGAESKNDATAGPRAAIALAQAVTAAEQHAGGRAVRAEYEQTRRGWAYDVEVLANGEVFDVRVDATTGAVLESSRDVADRDDGQDGQD